jgi:hypothetical protein
MKPHSGSRKTAELSEPVHQWLNLYALSASAAGVGMLALTQCAEAKIVYTPAHQIIGKNISFNLDLNHDGITDFIIRENAHRTTSGEFQVLFIKGSSINKIEGVPGSHSFHAADLAPDDLIPNGEFSPAVVMANQCSGFGGTSCTTHSRKGSWFNVTNHYLGLKFTIDGGTHYGWARMTVNFVNNNLTATLTGYAYETVPNEGIIAGRIKNSDGDAAPDASLSMPTPEGASLGMLALGSPGVSIWRREELISATQ